MQDTIFRLNDYKNKKYFSNCIDNLIQLEEWIKTRKKLPMSIHPNLINYLIDNRIIKEFNYINRKSYLIFKDLTKKLVYRQIHFTHDLLKMCKKSKTFSKLFLDGDNNFKNITIENQVEYGPLGKSFRRIDIELDIYDQKILIEYLEPSHEKEIKECSNYQKVRNYNLIHESKKDIKFIIFVIDKFWQDNKKYRNMIVNKLLYRIKDLCNIKNQDKFIISEINKYIQNKKLSKIFYNTHKEKNNCNLEFKTINKFFKIKQEYINKIKQEFISIVDENVSNDDLNIDDLESDSESEIELIEDEEIKYYQNNKLSYHGLCLYLSLCKRKYFRNILDYMIIPNFITKLGNAAIGAITKIMEKEIKIKENLIFGYKYLYKEF